jgi:hypothetical protein
MRRTAASFLAVAGIAAIAGLATVSFSSCSGRSEVSALIWTDAPELAIAAELFDARGSSSTVRLAWKRDPAEALLAAKGKNGTAALPALVIGRSLRSSALRDSLSSLDYLLKRRPNRDAFYPELLEGGVVANKRVLLPLSFNLPAIAFLRDSPAAGDGFTISLEDIAVPSSAYDRSAGGANARMGFSPRWNARFLVTALDSSGARFREAKGGASRGPDLAWDAPGLATALSELASWSARANGPAALEDDFQFRYLFSPPYRWLKEGRTLYAYMDSSELFLVSEEKRTGIDFRWYANGGRIRVSDDAVYAGLVRGASGRGAAESFLRWIFTPEAQRAILERSRSSRSMDYSFGLAGGFSSIRSVNEEIFPAFYPALVGHAPPAGKLVAPALLPGDWPALRAAVIGPWALEATARSAGSLGDNPSDELSARIADYRERESLQ